jgi:hypothetical protein
MFRKHLRVPSPALVIAGAALFLSLGGAAYAANGSALKIGFPNTGTAQTKLASTNNGAALALQQNSAGGSATALSLAVPSGKAPMTVNSSTRVNNLNADQLDGLTSGDFSRLIALKMSNASGTLAAGDNFFLSPAWTPEISGRCLVTASSQINGSANTDVGPFYRIAIKQGSSAPVNDGFYGHYFEPDPSGYSDDISRTSAVNVTAGVPVQFGGYFGSPPADWVGDNANVHVTVMCTSVGSLAGAGSPTAAAARMAQHQ